VINKLTNHDHHSTTTKTTIINPLRANVVYIRHDADVSCSGCEALQGKLLKMTLVLLKEEKTCYKMIYYTLYLS